LIIKTISPLRYPGGKSRAVSEIATKYIIPNIPKNNQICSPFFGGGSIEIYLAKRGCRVYGYDAFLPLVDFWQVLLKNTNKLANAVERKLRVSETEFASIQESFRDRYDEFSKIRSATIFYLLNRTSYSGTTLSGGMAIDHDKKNRWEKINPRFNKASVKRLRNFSVKNFTVNKLDFRKSILKHKGALVYADPPYYIGKKKLYGNLGDMQFKQEDHEALAKILKKRRRWILSYNDVPEVRKLYRGFRIRKLSWSYGMTNVKSRKKKHSNEILILSNDIKIQTQTKLF